MNDFYSNTDRPQNYGNGDRPQTQWEDVHRIEGMPDKMGFIPVAIVRRAKVEYGNKFCVMLGLIMEDGFRPQRFLRSIHVQQYSALLGQASRYISDQYEQQRNVSREDSTGDNGLSAPMSAFLSR